MGEIQHGKKWYDMYLSALYNPAISIFSEAKNLFHIENQREKALEFANEAKDALEHIYDNKLHQALSSYAAAWKEKINEALIEINGLINSIIEA